MSIFKALLGILKVVLPFLRSAAEKAFKKLPKEKQEQLIKISQMVEVIKKMQYVNDVDVYKAIFLVTGLAKLDVDLLLKSYYEQKGIVLKGYEHVFSPIWQDAKERTETGLKSLWSGLSNIVCATVAEIDWELLLMGVGEYVYRTFVKGKIKI